MNNKHLLIGLLVVGVLGLGLGAALYIGVGPAPGGPDGTDQPLADFPTVTETTSPDDDDSETVSAETTPTPPFLFTIDSIEECGLTCRDVTVSLFNNQDQSASNITVYTRIYAGQNNTAAGDRIWSGQEAVGSLAAEDSYTTTRRVELSFQEAQKVDNRDGWITIVTSVETADQTVTFQNSEQVA